MNFVKMLQALRTSLPFMKSFFRAYKETTGAKKGSPDQSFFDRYFSAAMKNTTASPLTESTALQILNIEKSLEEVDPKLILERYYVLFKKNDPNNGGTAYLQSKIYASKEVLMTHFPNAAELEQQFYMSVVEPEIKAEEEAKKQKKANQEQKQTESIQSKQSKESQQSNENQPKKKDSN